MPRPVVNMLGPTYGFLGVINDDVLSPTNILGNYQQPRPSRLLATAFFGKFPPNYTTFG